MKVQVFTLLLVLNVSKRIPTAFDITCLLYNKQPYPYYSLIYSFYSVLRARKFNYFGMFITKNNLTNLDYLFILPRPSRRGIFHHHYFCDFTVFTKVFSEGLWKKHNLYLVNKDKFVHTSHLNIYYRNHHSKPVNEQWHGQNKNYLLGTIFNIFVIIILQLN